MNAQKWSAFHLDWYLPRANLNEQITEFLIKKIRTHEPDFPMTDAQLRRLKYEDLFEIAIPCVNKKLAVTLGPGSDLSDNSDAKVCVSQSRNNNKAKNQWLNSYSITNIHAKIGPLRVLAYNKLKNDFDFFFIEYDKHKHLTGKIEITIEQCTSATDPGFTGSPRFHRKWWDCRCSTFEEMCMK